jgi:two-component system chemotaxis response regulator CheB
MRGVIARVLGGDPRFEVVGQAGDGTLALKLAGELKPDLITMDYNMPGMNGVATTRAILRQHPVPIVMLSAHTREGETATVEALAAGAVDFVPKPEGEVSTHLSAVREELFSKLINAAQANLRATLPPVASEPSQAPRSIRIPRAAPAGLKLVVIACSTGGPQALTRLLPRLSLVGRAGLIVVQHMPAGYTTALAAQLAECCPFPIREAASGDTVTSGIGLVAPGDLHLTIERGGRLNSNDSAPVHGVRPAADVTLAAAAQHFGARCVGVVLTGMGRDGARGLAAVKAAGGVTLAQDRATSTVYGMPKAAVELGVVDTVAPLDRLSEVINKLIGG